MNIFKSRVSIELERLSSSLDIKNNAFGVSLVAHTKRLELINQLIANEQKLSAIAEKLKRKNFQVVFNPTLLENNFIGGIKIKVVDFCEEIKQLSADMDKITKKRVRVAALSLTVTALSILSSSYVSSDYILVLSSWAGFAILLLGQWVLMKPERQVTATAINLRTRNIKEANRLRAVASEIDRSNQFINDRIEDIKSSVETITQLVDSGRYNKTLKDEFIIVNAIFTQILYHLDKDKVD